MGNDTNDAVIYVRGISTEAKRAFKSLCARHGLTLGEGIERLLRRAAADEKLLKDTKAVEN